MTYTRVIGALIMGVFLSVVGVPKSFADTYPTKTVRLVIPFPPGGTTDIIGRMLAQKLSDAFGQAVIVDNKAGAGGLVGTDAVAKSAPDGHTLLLGNSGALATGLSLYPNVPYDVLRDFAPISLISDVTIVLAVNPSLPAKSGAELVAYAKANPGKLNVALPSIGSMHHLLTEMFKISAGVNIVNVPYKGSAPAIVDLMGGQVDMDFDNLPALLPYIKSGRVKGLAVASAARSEFLPELPTMKEAGLPEIVASPWFAMVAPVGTPRPIVDKVNREVVKIMRSDEMKQRLHSQGANPLWSTPEECGEFIRSEIVRWEKVVKASGARLE